MSTFIARHLSRYLAAPIQRAPRKESERRKRCIIYDRGEGEGRGMEREKWVSLIATSI